MSALTSATYVALALHFARKVLRKATPEKPAGTSPDQLTQRDFNRLAGRKLAIPHTLDGKSFTLLSVVPKDINDTSALDTLYQNIELLLSGIFPYTKILGDGVSPLGWFICSGISVADLPRFTTDDVVTLMHIIDYYKCKIN